MRRWWKPSTTRCTSSSLQQIEQGAISKFQMVVSFLTTQVKDPNKDDLCKLLMVLKCLNGTWYIKLILRVDDMNFTVHWYVNGSHQVHEDCRGQIGCLMTMRKGGSISSSNVMKCNTRSSTESELILLRDKLPDIIWMRYFIECQGYDINEYIIFQDNMSSYHWKRKQECCPWDE